MVVLKFIALTLEVLMAFLALAMTERVLWIFDWSFKESIEAAVLALGGWWGFIRSVVRPPVFVELRPVESLQKHNPVRGLEPVVVNASRMPQRVNVRITGFAKERKIDNLPLGPGQRFSLSGIAQVKDFEKTEAEAAVTWTDWRNHKWLRWLTTRSLVLSPKNFAGYVPPLSVHQSGPSENLKEIACALNHITKNRTFLAEQQGMQDGVTVRLVAPVDGVLVDKLRHSNGFCRVERMTNENELHDKTAQGAPVAEFAYTGGSHECLVLRFLSDDDMRRICLEQQSHEQRTPIGYG